MKITKQHLTEYLPRQLKHIIPIVLKFIKQYKINDVKEHLTSYGGGGLYYYMILLNNNKILQFGNDYESLWISNKEFKTFNSYFNDNCNGFGWEHNQPNYENRCLSFDDIENKKINLKLLQLIHSLHDLEHIDLDQHFEDDLKLIEIDTPFGLIVIRHGNLATPPNDESKYLLDIIFNRRLLGSFFIYSYLKSKKVKYKIKYIGLMSTILDKRD